MAASFTMLHKMTLSDGQVMEQGTWTSSGGTTTLNITTDTTAGSPAITKIMRWSLSSNGDTAVIAAQDVADTTLKITFTANDSGQYTIQGPGA